mgnify:CR=1 FL=1|jgi:hypothetical protein|nr:MAG TPA: hypothetical protein [Caudoviricetes sp.]
MNNMKTLSELVENKGHVLEDGQGLHYNDI